MMDEQVNPLRKQPPPPPPAAAGADDVELSSTSTFSSSQPTAASSPVRAVSAVSAVNAVSAIPEAIPITVRPEAYSQQLNQQPAGLLKNMQDISETPQDAMKRILMPGEVVISDFDCYFPHKILPMWKIILYCVLTGGLYLLVLAYRALQRCCYRMKCCTPKFVEFVRGKMAVTNLGRMICWAQEGEQVKQDRSCLFDLCCCFCKMCCADTCAPPTTFELKIVTKIHTINNIAEISHFYGTTSKCFCICNDFTAGVKISFNEFDHHRKRIDSYVYTQPYGAYKLLFQVGAILEWVATWIENSLFLMASDAVFLTTTTGDLMHTHDHASVIEDSATLYARFLDCLPTQPDIVVENPELNAANKFATAKDFLDVTIVADDGTVTLPAKFFTYLRGEKVIASTGQVYTMNTMEWIKSVLTFGIYYVWYVRQRKFLRSAIVLTNKRIFVVDIFQRAGGIPRTMNNFSLQITSYFPQQITSGYVSAQSKAWMQVAIGSKCGGIFFTLYNRKRSLPFAKAVQLSTYRLGARFVFDAEASTAETGSSSNSQQQQQKKKTKLLTAEDLAMVPLFAQETLREGIVGAFAFEPYCFANQGVMKLCCTGDEALCSKDVCGSCVFPWCTYACTCALRPFQASQDMYFSENTFFYIRRSGNFGLCGWLNGEGQACCTGPCAKTDDIVISWAAIRDVQGHRLTIESEGQETIMRRCCKNSTCGSVCCPISFNELEVAVNTPVATFVVNDDKKNHDYSKDAGLRNMIALLDAVEKTNFMNAMNR